MRDDVFKKIFWLLLMPTLLGTMMEELLNSLLTDPFVQVYHMRQKQYFLLMLMESSIKPCFAAGFGKV